MSTVKISLKEFSKMVNTIKKLKKANKALNEEIESYNKEFANGSRNKKSEK